MSYQSQRRKTYFCPQSLLVTFVLRLLFSFAIREESFILENNLSISMRIQIPLPDLILRYGSRRSATVKSSTPSLPIVCAIHGQESTTVAVREIIFNPRGGVG